MTEEQFTPLAQRYMDTVFRVAYSYLRCRDDADDVTQDVLIQLYKEDKAFESDAHVKTGSSALRSTAAKTCSAPRGTGRRTSPTTRTRWCSSSPNAGSYLTR